MAEEIPIKFEYKGRLVEGKFARVAGSGNSSLFHLYELKNNRWYYCGQLFCTQLYGWRYAGNSYEDIADYFEQFIIGWYQ